MLYGKILVLACGLVAVSAVRGRRKSVQLPQRTRTSGVIDDMPDLPDSNEGVQSKSHGLKSREEILAEKRLGLKCMYPGCELESKSELESGGAIFKYCRSEQSHALYFDDNSRSRARPSEKVKRNHWPTRLSRPKYWKKTVNRKVFWIRPLKIPLRCVYPTCQEPAVDRTKEILVGGAIYLQCARKNHGPVFDAKGEPASWPVLFRKTTYKKTSDGYWIPPQIIYMCMFPGCKNPAKSYPETTGSETIFSACSEMSHMLASKRIDTNGKATDQRLQLRLDNANSKFRTYTRSDGMKFWILFKTLKGPEKGKAYQASAPRPRAPEKGKATHTSTRRFAPERGSLLHLASKRVEKVNSGGNTMRRRLNRTERIMNHLKHL